MRLHLLLLMGILGAVIGLALLFSMFFKLEIPLRDMLSFVSQPLPPSEISVSVPHEERAPLEMKYDNPESFSAPLPKSEERVTKKPFGVHIDPATSPVRPERFSGYHTGTDFEIFPGEEDEDVAVSAICTGELLSKRLASGYGGVVVQSCKYEDKPVTVVYGHVRLSSVASEIGDEIIAGEYLGYLGTGFSAETDGERKHLHLSIHRGTEEDIRGYVGSETELSAWIDPCLLVCHSGEE